MLGQKFYRLLRGVTEASFPSQGRAGEIRMRDNSSFGWNVFKWLISKAERGFSRGIQVRNSCILRVGFIDHLIQSLKTAELLRVKVF